MDEELRTQLEAQAFRGLLEHLRERTDAQNIDIMNLAGLPQLPVQMVSGRRPGAGCRDGLRAGPRGDLWRAL